MAGLAASQSTKNSMTDNIELDENVIQAIPDSSSATRIHATSHGASHWTRTFRVTAESSRGAPRLYFLKLCPGDRGRGMVEGEFESIRVIHTTVPKFAPRPIAWGTCKGDPDLHFFLSTFHEMVENDDDDDDDEGGRLPEISCFTACLARMHREAVSPTGRYGFHVTTYNGELPQDVRWTDTWEECFVNGTRRDFELEKEARGESAELEELRGKLFEKVIPRLLRPLESGGRRVLPSFIHGDLWHGNASNDVRTNHPIVFDAAGFYGHNEYDVKAMRIPRYKFGRNYLDAYHTKFPIAEPKEDLEARLALYSLRSYLHESALYASDPKPRQELIDEMHKLVDMFPDGLDGYDLEKGRPIEGD